jgi:hypothetical protein
VAEPLGDGEGLPLSVPVAPGEGEVVSDGDAVGDDEPVGEGDCERAPSGRSRSIDVIARTTTTPIALDRFLKRALLHAVARESATNVRRPPHRPQRDDAPSGQCFDAATPGSCAHAARTVLDGGARNAQVVLG